MDLRESMWDSVKFFCEGLHIQLAAKLFCLETFMVRIRYVCLLTFNFITEVLLLASDIESFTHYLL